MSKLFLPYFLFIVFLTTINVATAQKVDTIVHVNGNIITGEIKKITEGILIYKMEEMGTIKIELEKINTLKSPKLMQVRTKRGELIFGKIDTSSNIGYVKVGYGVNKKNLLVLDIVEAYPIKSTFWLRIIGNFDFGVDYSKSTDMLRVNTSGAIEYRKKKSSYKVVWNTYGSSQKVDTSIIQNQKADMNFAYKHLIRGPWLWTGTFGENSNSELGLNLRLYVGLNIQCDILYTTKQHLFVQLGANYNREFVDDGGAINNPEGLLSLNYNIYKHTDPEIYLTSNVEMYPNLSFNGRWRLDSNVDFKIEVFNNFYVGFKVYTNFDSNPSSIYAETFDWGTSFTVGYSFN